MAIHLHRAFVDLLNTIYIVTDEESRQIACIAKAISALQNHQIKEEEAGQTGGWCTKQTLISVTAPAGGTNKTLQDERSEIRLKSNRLD